MKAPDGAIKTGSFIVILKEASDLNDVIDKIKQFSDKALVQRYTDIVEKSITVSAARNVIEKVNCMHVLVLVPQMQRHFFTSVAGHATSNISTWLHVDSITNLLNYRYVSSLR